MCYGRFEDLYDKQFETNQLHGLFETDEFLGSDKPPYASTLQYGRIRVNARREDALYARTRYFDSKICSLRRTCPLGVGI